MELVKIRNFENDGRKKRISFGRFCLETQNEEENAKSKLQKKI